MEDPDGLLAVTRSGEVFLLRESPSSGNPGAFWILWDSFDARYPMRALAIDGLAPTWSPLLDGAALSPNGNWTVFAAQNGVDTGFHMVRIRVR